LKSSGIINFRNNPNSDSANIVADSIKKLVKQGIKEGTLTDTAFTKFLKVSDDTATVSAPDTAMAKAENKVMVDKEGDQIGEAFSFLFNLLLLGFLAGFIFNLPFKRYFSKKRQNKYISDNLNKFVKRFLLYTPLINAGILGLAYGIAHIYMYYNLLSGSIFNYEIEKDIYQNFFLISLIGSVLAVLFIFFWEKHRVHIKYIEFVFSDEELKQRIFKTKKPGKIRNRMMVSAAMTTLLPLSIVILYLFLSITNIRDLNFSELNDDHKEILFGEFMTFEEAFTEPGNGSTMLSWLFYINAINSLFMSIGITSGIFIAFLYIIFFVKWTTQDVVYPIKELLQRMAETGQGKMYNFGLVRTNNELGLLTEGYNDMSQKLGDYIHNMSEMTDAYSRFVPKQFIEYLEKDSFVDIKLGDQVQKEMTVLFSDIRSFTEISETMSPKENFDFINYYLGYMEPVIRNNNGFIDKYIGDSIMALFSESPEDAINAAIEMRKKLSQFNQVMDQFGKPVINSGIGIHFGTLMLGIVGGEGRMDGTVISDAVNLASRLEGLTKIYGSSIIISQDTLIKMEKSELYQYRFLDIVKVKGKKEPSYIFEIIDGDPDDIKKLKLQTKDIFAEAINLYKSQEFSKAKKGFESIIEINQKDKAAKTYLKRCNTFIESGVPDDWDGITIINWKA
jgi:class 3 adenylate cyclase